MASVSYSEDLTCAICLSFFTDPVNLPCAHSFCRECITHFVSSQPHCPQCRESVSQDVKCLPTSYLLSSLAEKAKEAEKIQTQRGQEKAEMAELCPEHEEKLKLFCATDQQLACIICRDSEKHAGHKFKPTKEAAHHLRQELANDMEKLLGNILAIENVATTQREEITKTKEKSPQLTAQICRQFEEMHQFLRKREDEIKNELKHKEEDAVENMSKMLNSIETALSESKELQGKVTSVLKIEDSERLLKSWFKESSMMTQKDLFRPRLNDFTVVKSSLSLGPYESHLQFFMWKEMLQVVQPRADLLTLESSSEDITVSSDGRSLLCTPQSNQAQSAYSLQVQSMSGRRRRSAYGYNYEYDNSTYSSQHSQPTTHQAFSVDQFTPGQHYWETEVGNRDYWELGTNNDFLKYDGQKYAASSQNKITELAFGGRPRKIGIYLDFLSQKLSFYDADSMTHIHTVSSRLKNTTVSAHFAIKSTAQDCNPLTVCWY
ncbi:nuclear factor 7, brain-like [Pempheris klunzingeri]|uniref:nuclear factor 7, brain-like n=1 Tax=Pempheris klunzingeri TaxID=3127111 RepID=UPI0039810151